jgi:hypothetical protein
MKALVGCLAPPRQAKQYGGVPRYRETHAFTARVIGDYSCKKNRAARKPGNGVGRRIRTTQGGKSDAHFSLLKHVRIGDSENSLDRI